MIMMDSCGVVAPVETASSKTALRKTVSSKKVSDKATPSSSKAAAVKRKKDDDELKRSLKLSTTLACMRQNYQ